MGEVDYESLPTNSLWQHLLAGALAGMMEHCSMYPVDCVKVDAYVHAVTDCCNSALDTSHCSWVFCSLSSRPPTHVHGKLKHKQKKSREGLG